MCVWYLDLSLNEVRADVIQDVHGIQHIQIRILIDWLNLEQGTLRPDETSLEQRQIIQNRVERRGKGIRLQLTGQGQRRRRGRGRGRRWGLCLYIRSSRLRILWSVREGHVGDRVVGKVVVVTRHGQLQITLLRQHPPQNPQVQRCILLGILLGIPRIDLECHRLHRREITLALGSIPEHSSRNPLTSRGIPQTVGGILVLLRLHRHILRHFNPTLGIHLRCVARVFWYATCTPKNPINFFSSEFPH